MKNTTTAPKAEGVRAAQEDGGQKAEDRRGNADILKAESRNVNAAQSRAERAESRNPVPSPFRVPAGEKDFLATLMQFMRSAKLSKDREVASAARRWETAIEFRVRMTMQYRERVANRKVHQGLVRLGEGRES